MKRWKSVLTKRERDELSGLGFSDDEIKGITALAVAEPVALEQRPKGRLWPLALSFAAVGLFFLMAFHVHLFVMAFMPTSIGLSQPRCTFADGTSEPGTCMLVADFYNRADGASLFPFVTHDDWNSALQDVTPDVSCFRHENVSIAGGTLNLSTTHNPRSSCPQSWTATTAYNATACGGSGCAANWPVGQPTSYDVGYVDVPTFQGLYGHITMVFTASGGPGPGTDFTFWGINCQDPAGVVSGLVKGLFTLAGPCNWPASGSQEFDLYQFSHSNGNQNSSMYTANQNAAPLMSTFFGTSYYGFIYTNQPGVPFAAATTFSPNIVPSDPTVGVHTASVQWSPGFWSVTIDGIETGHVQAAYVSNEAKFPMIWNAITTTATGTTFTDLKVASFHWVCNPGNPCRWVGP